MVTKNENIAVYRKQAALTCDASVQLECDTYRIICLALSNLPTNHIDNFSNNNCRVTSLEHLHSIQLPIHLCIYYMNILYCMYTSTLCIFKRVLYDIYIYIYTVYMSMHIYKHTTLLLFLKLPIFSFSL